MVEEALLARADLDDDRQEREAAVLESVAAAERRTAEKLARLQGRLQ